MRFAKPSSDQNCPVHLKRPWNCAHWDSMAPLPTGTADMNVYANAWDCPMVTYGPGDSDLDHAPNEHIVLEEFDLSVDVLDAVTERLL